MKIICFDLDGVIFNNNYGDYTKAKPIKKSINKINSLYNQGHIIKILLQDIWEEITKIFQKHIQILQIYKKTT